MRKEKGIDSKGRDRDDAETPDRPYDVVVSPTCHATEEGRLGDSRDSSVTYANARERKRRGVEQRARALQNLRERERARMRYREGGDCLP